MMTEIFVVIWEYGYEIYRILGICSNLEDAETIVKDDLDFPVDAMEVQESEDPGGHKNVVWQRRYKKGDMEDWTIQKWVI